MLVISYGANGTAAKGSALLTTCLVCAVDGPTWRREYTLATGVYMDQHLIEAISDGVAKLTFNRPERLNALSTPIMEGLLEALPRLARDPTIGVIVLTGAGRAFCAGGDVKSMAEGSAERSVEQAVIHLRGRMEVSRLGPRVALARMKQNFNAAENGTFAELLDLEARNQIETGRTDDHKEAARAFVEKRPPVFTGR